VEECRKGGRGCTSSRFGEGIDTPPKQTLEGLISRCFSSEKVYRREGRFVEGSSAAKEPSSKLASVLTKKSQPLGEKSMIWGREL